MLDNRKDLQWFCLPTLDDNYTWIIRDLGAEITVVVDPATAEDVHIFMQARQWRLDAIFNTHHHWDHVGGNKELREMYPHVQIYGSKKDAGRIPYITHLLEDGESLQLGSMEYVVLSVDGHTLGHIAYYERHHKWLFCGDTLFSLGCGRLFEGSPQAMLNSLEKIKHFCEETLVFCAHEYTLDNIRFAHSIGFHPPGMDAFYDEVVKKRQQSIPTVPFLLATQLRLNPFLCSSSAYLHRISGLSKHASALDVFTWLRRKKNLF